jgi:hypothetical protein
MAGLLLIAMGCIPLSGCLFPQDEQVLGELPPKRNSTIRIVPERQVPRVTFYNSTTCTGNPTFQLTVEDDDLTDTVTSLWFIGDLKSQDYRPNPIPPSGSKTRFVTAPSSLGFKSALANLRVGTETLTVYVSDTGFQEVVDGLVALQERPAPTDPNTPRDEPSFDRYTWTLNVEACP